MAHLQLKRVFRNVIGIFTIASLLCAAPFPLSFRSARAIPCGLPTAADGCAAVDFIETFHDNHEDRLMADISNEMQNFRTWLTDVFFRQQVLPALMLFTEQMSVVAMEQVFIFGTFLDAKHQLETQRLFQELQTQAHKDYHPSEDFCWFGTNVRSMAASEQLGRHNAIALAQIEMDRQLGNVNNGAAETVDQDKANRWKQFTTTFCDPKDNNWLASTAGTGLQLACNPAPANKDRYNIDVNYTRAIDEPRTLDVNFTDTAKTNKEEDVMALANNLYGHNVLSRTALKELLKNVEYQHVYLALRSVAAKRSVAMNSFDAIVGLKSSGDAPMTGGPAAPNTSVFLGAIMTELGVPAADVYKIIGENPSYYAQLELLAKKIYQNTDFYSNLYDKPTNVARKSVALKAIEIMVDRAIFESQIRQEMATSVLLSARLRGQFRDVNKNLAGGGSN